MLNSIRSILAVAAVACLPAITSAQEVTEDFEISVGDTSFSNVGFLIAGTTWTANYTLAPGVAPFYLNLDFLGIQIAEGDLLGTVRFGINAADHSYDEIVEDDDAGGTGERGFVGFATLGAIYVDGPFSVVHTIPDDAPDGLVFAGYEGTLVPATVPEIGPQGAMAALLLVLGGIAVMGGTRRPARQAILVDA